jgi:seryl-tRNA synthetase
LELAEKASAEVQAKLEVVFSSIPNLPHESTPAGLEEEDNVELKKWGHACRI